MIPMIMAAVQASLAVAGAGLQIGGMMGQRAQLRRQMRAQLGVLQDNYELAGMKGAFQQGQVSDQVDAAIGRQANFFASGNMDFASGSPALLAAQTAALGMQDQMLIGARTLQDRAAISAQKAGVASRYDDAMSANSFNMASVVLNTASNLASIGGNAAKAGGFQGFSGFGGSGGAGGFGGPLDIRAPGTYMGSLY